MRYQAVLFVVNTTGVAGIGTLWMIQTFIIVGGNLGLLPLTGITLPFISFGGSSLLINFLALGMVLRISADQSTSIQTLKNIMQENV